MAAKAPGPMRKPPTTMPYKPAGPTRKPPAVTPPTTVRTSPKKR